MNTKQAIQREFIRIYSKKDYNIHYPHKRDSSNYELLSEVVASSAIQCYCYWMQHPDEVDDEKLFEMVQSTINSMIHVL